MLKYRPVLLSCIAHILLYISATLSEEVTTHEAEFFNQLTDNNNRPYRICVLDKRQNIYNNANYKCSVLQKTNAPVECVIAIDRLDCLRKVSLQKADFAVFEAEELLVASNHKNLENVLVVSEFQYYYSTYNKFQYSLHAVVRNDANINSLQDLEGKMLCHPGTDPDGTDHSDIFSQFFEDRVVVQKCESNRTVAENRVKSLSDFFGSSCRAGSWALDPILDKALKTKYSNLCQSCEAPKSCSSGDEYWGRKNALLCLSDCNGDFAWGRLPDIRIHFQKFSFGRERLCNNVSFLCPDGTLQPLSTLDPCVWIQKPNTVVAAHRSVASQIQMLIKDVFITQKNGSAYRSALSTLLESPPRFANVELITPSDYLKQAEGFLSSTNAAKCGKDREIKLCAASKFEKVQCEWLSAAASSYGIEPPISCFEPPDLNCFSAIQNNLADVFFTNSDRLLPAIRDYNLQPLLYETVADSTKSKYFSILVDTHAGINKLGDLKGKKACFTAVDGVGWTTLFMELKKASLIPNVCGSTAAIAGFFGEICITSAVDSVISNRYSNIRYCNSELLDDDNKQSGIEREAVDCILNGGGDVAVVAVDSVSRYSDITGFLSSKSVKNLIGSRYKWLCGNSGLQAKPCLLAKTTMGQVLVRQDISYIRKEDIISTFNNLDSLFGGGNKKGKRSFSFELLAEFESSSEILFQDLGDRLELNNIYLEKHKFENSSYENEIQKVINLQRKCDSVSLDQSKSAAPLSLTFYQKYLFFTSLSLLVLLNRFIIFLHY